MKADRCPDANRLDGAKINVPRSFPADNISFSEEGNVQTFSVGRFTTC